MLKENKNFKFFLRVKLNTYSVTYNYNLFMSKTSYIVLKYLNINKRHKFYIFNMLYSYQLGYLFINKKIYLKTLLTHLKEKKIFLVYTKNVASFLFFLKDMFYFKNKTLLLKQSVYEKRDKNYKLKRYEFNNFYKFRMQKIYNSKYVFKKNLKNFSKSIDDVDYYFYDIFYPDENHEKLRVKYKTLTTKKNFSILFIKIKNNFISTDFYNKIYIYKNKISFLNNFKNILYYFMLVNLSIYRVFLCELNSLFVQISLLKHFFVSI